MAKNSFLHSFTSWIDTTFIDLARQFHWSYLPPLMVYMAAGIAGLTSIVGMFFIKDYLNLSAAFLASLGFWVGIPWTLKIPLGHIVDLIWKQKAVLVYIGATLIAVSVLIMYGLIAHTASMTALLPAETWFIIASLLSPTGYVVQDVVADAMTVEAVPTLNKEGNAYSAAEIKVMHTTMQTLGRISIIGGLVAVSLLNLTMFSNVENMTEEMKLATYANIYLLALFIPFISISGVILSKILLKKRAKHLQALGHNTAEIDQLLYQPSETTQANWWILGGSFAFVVFSLSLGISEVAFAQEIIFTGSLSIILFLMYRLLLELEPQQRNMLIGTALIIFMFRAVPSVGPVYSWFEIDELGFDQYFLSKLSLIASVLIIFGMLVLRPMMANRSIAFVVVLLTILGSILLLPNIALYYGIHEWTAAHTQGVVDARFIAIINTALESPLGQISMIPMLAWIANNAPSHLKATFFAVMASFTNLALSAASLGTKYLNEIFIVTREVRDQLTQVVTGTADYSELGYLLITVGLIGLLVPLLTVVVVQRSKFNTQQ